MGNRNVLAKTAILLALTLVFQIGFNMFAQPIVGPLVNMMLIISTLIIGIVPAIVIGCLTPIIAFSLGIMPLFPLVPFIMVGNSILIILFSFVKAKFKNEYVALIAGAIGKFLFLAFSVRYLLIYFVPKVPPKLIAALSLPQLYTALIGGFIALLIVRRLPSNTKNQYKI